MNSAPDGMIEDNAMRAIDRLAEMDPREIDLDTLLALGQKIRAISTRACQAQTKVAAE